MTSWTKTAISGALLLSALNAIAQSGWKLTRLPDTGNSRANAINNVGQIVGSSWRENSWDDDAAVLWQDGRFTYLGSLNGGYSIAYDINDAGQVVGGSYGRWGNLAQNRGFLWQGGRITELPPAGGGFSIAAAINASGTVVGSTVFELGRAFPTVWNNGQATAIPLHAGYDNGYAVDINKGGQILLTNDGRDSPPPLWFVGRDDSFTNLEHLTFAQAINDTGQVVGSRYDLSNGNLHAVLWEDGHTRDLGAPAGFSGSMAMAINASGQVVGYAVRDEPGIGLTYHGVLWDGERIVDLTLALGGAAAGWSIRPSDINDAGVIVGEAVGTGLHSFAFMLTPVPEPATSVLLLAGGMLVWRLRRRAAARISNAQRTNLRYAL